MSEESKYFQSVAIAIEPAWGPLLLAMGEKLKKRYGTKLHLYLRTSREVAGFEKMNHEGKWDSITCSDVLRSAVKEEIDPEKVVQRARNYEEKLGETLNHLTFNHRQFGRGFSPGGFKYPQSRYFKNVDYLHMVHAYNEALAFWEREIEEKGITLLLHGEKEPATLSRPLGIPYRRLDVSRYKNLWYWTPNEFFFNPRLEKTYDELTEWPEKNEINEPYGLSATKDKIGLDRANFISVLKRTAMAAIRYAVLWSLGQQKARNFFFSDFVSMPYREWKGYRQMTGKNVLSLAELKGRQFVFYPAHKEPEFSLQLMSPECFNQHDVILKVAKDLPAGVILVVKENLWSLGRRPENFYEQISDLKNVVFIDVRERGVDVLREALATIIITGTAGMEAAVMGKPVVSFGMHNGYSLLDHVFTVKPDTNLAEVFRKIVDGDFDQEAAVSDGARYLEAVIKSSFDLGDFSVVGEGKAKYSNFNDDHVDTAIAELIKSFDAPNITCVSNIRPFVKQRQA